MEWLNELAQNREAPLLAAFALGLLTAIAPCPLATIFLLKNRVEFFS